MKAKTRTVQPKPAARTQPDGRIRAVVDQVLPQVDGGRFAVKRVIGDTMVVTAHAFTDGHDAIVCMLGFRHESDSDWTEVEMTALVNDEWTGSFALEKLGR